MARIDPTLRRSIENAVGMTPAEIERDPAEYIHRFVEAGITIIDLRQRMAGAPAAKRKP